MSRILAAGVVALVGCGTVDDLVPPYGTVTCAGERKEVNIRTDPTACGACPGIGAVCAEGVACIDFECDYTSVIHCGAEGRACMGEGAVCIPVPEGVDAELPPHGEVINGYACAVIPGNGGVDGGADDAGVGGEPADEVQRPAYGAPTWVLVPGVSEGCHRGDELRCHHAFVPFTDICGEVCAPIALDYDYRVMATEMSRAQYRDAVCDCERVRTQQCADVCRPEKADRDAMPMTGLNWCMAQAACEAIGGRLPTAVERARLEQLASADRALFSDANCLDWQRRAGSQPRIGECIDLDGTAALVEVDDPRGVMGAGAGISPQPPALYHSLGNASEWLLDGAAQIRCGELEDAATRLRVPQAWEGVAAIQGRSVMSPRGEPVTQVAVSPSTRAVDLGVRCVQAEGGPSVDEVLSVREYCDFDTPLGQSAVRRNITDALYRAVEACPVTRRPVSLFGEKVQDIADALVHPERPLVWRTGDHSEIGQAWFTPDAQWWIGQPAAEGGALTFEFYPWVVARLSWVGFEQPATTVCAEQMSTLYPDHDGYIVRQLDFIVEQDELGMVFNSDEPTQLACTLFDCAVTDAGVCEACPAWRIPVVVGFERIEPFDHPDLCE